MGSPREIHIEACLVCVVVVVVVVVASSSQVQSLAASSSSGFGPNMWPSGRQSLQTKRNKRPRFGEGARFSAPSK